MEMQRKIRASRGPDTSPDLARITVQPYVKPFRKVHIIYYLCRNGQLEHPHFMELTQLPNQQLRLKDVIQRLTVLRGMGMPSLYSWSCKRSYKNGYVWNDLAENDVIHPADGVEYILKGSEIITQSPSGFENSNSRTRRTVNEHRHEESSKYVHGIDDDDEDEYTPNSTCSRGVSTDPTTGGVSSPSSTSDSDPSKLDRTCESSRFDLDEEEMGVGASRVPSMVLRLIACGTLRLGGKSPAGHVSRSQGGSLSDDRRCSLRGEGSGRSVQEEIGDGSRGVRSGPSIEGSTSGREEESQRYLMS